MKRIYLDYASLTPVDPRVLREVKRFSSTKYANPSSLYKEGVEAKKTLEASRKKVADCIHALPDEVVFTSGGTEANGLALEGVARTAHRNGFAKPHMIISNIEHSSIIELANMMEKQGVEVTRISVDSSGVVSPEEIAKAIRPETFLVSIMMVNNEIGTVQPIREIAKVIRHARKEFHATDGKKEYPLLHTDAAQALYEDMNVLTLGVDLMTLDGSKVYGPRGIGCLYLKRVTPIEPIAYGGGQEKGLRSGTENVAAAAGFALALELVADGGEKEGARLGELREYFIAELRKVRSDITVNPRGATHAYRGNDNISKSDKNLVTLGETGRDGVYNKTAPIKNTALIEVAPHILNISIPGIDNEFFVLQLDAKGIAISTKSSCLRDEDESYVLKAIGANSKTSVRFSFGRGTTKGELKKALKVIQSVAIPK